MLYVNDPEKCAKFWSEQVGFIVKEEGDNIVLENKKISLQIYSPSIYGKFMSNNTKSALLSNSSAIVLSNFSSITAS